MVQTLTEYVKKEDLATINQALSHGDDVRIQVTPGNGCRIVSDRVRVLKKRGATQKEQRKEA